MRSIEQDAYSFGKRPLEGAGNGSPKTHFWTMEVQSLALLAHQEATLAVQILQI